ncbi:HisA/HisF-related TIM barrel protein [Candidatus Pelagibacter sp.]|nr:HisA/HisF-related TIM barrel protein [Candidatus Pelagibacter sp.]
MRVIPKIEIKNNFVIKGINFEGLRKLGDPKKFIEKYYNDGCDEIIISDVVASLYGRNHLFSLIEEITKSVFIPITLVGGLRCIDDVDRAFKSGADKIGLNSALIKNLNFLKDVVKKYGEANIVVSIETKKIKGIWKIFYLNGREPSEITLKEWLPKLLKIGFGELLINSINYDGTLKGPDIELINEIQSLNIKKPIIYSSGIGKYKDIILLNKILKNQAISIASGLHYNKIHLKQIYKLLKS